MAKRSWFEKMQSHPWCQQQEAKLDTTKKNSVGKNSYQQDSDYFWEKLILQIILKIVLNFLAE